MANYGLLWLVYLLASTLFIVIFWRLVQFKRILLLTYTLRALAIALVFTPWVSHVDGSYLAPALMVLALDMITLGVAAAPRAFVPLFLSRLLSCVVAVLVWAWHRKGRSSGLRS